MDQDTLSYYSSLYNGVEDMLTAVTTFKPNLVTWARAGKLAATVDSQAALHGRDLFHSFQPLAAQPDRGRGKGNDVGAIVGAYLDFDLAEPGISSAYATKNPEATIDDVHAALEAWGYPKASAVVRTGNGLHFEWRLDVPFRIENEADRTRAATLLRDFNGYAVAKGAEDGWKLDNVGDLARVKRAVGSLNYKDAANPKPVTVAELHLERRYSLETLEAVAALHTPRKATTARPRSGEAKVSDKPQWDSVKAGCRFARHVNDHAASLSEPEWQAAASLVGVCENGEALFHELSAHDPRYDRLEATDKLHRAVTEAKPRTCAAIENGAPGHKGCETCPLRGRIHSPIALGFDTPAVAHLVSHHVLDNETGRYFDWERVEPVREDAFKREHRNRGLKDAAVAFTSSPNRILANSTDYLPGQPRLIQHDGRTVLNLYRPSPMKPAQGTCDNILAHFDYLIPDEIERNHLLDYFAHLVQQPATKIAHAVVIIGQKQGTGKSLAVSWMAPILGESNIARVSNEMIKSKWKADYADRQLCLVEEMMGDDRLSTYNDLKDWITSDQAPAEQKFVVSRLARTPRGWVFITNHADPFLAERNDRRLFVVEVDAEPKDAAYYDGLAKAAQVELPAFYQWLLDRDLSGFNPNARPPMTKAKARMQELARPPVEAAIVEAFQGQAGIFMRDFGTLEDVMTTAEATDARLGVVKKPDAMKALRALGAVSLEKQVRVNGRRVRLWIWAEHDHWTSASEGDLRAAYQPFAATPSLVALTH